MEGFRAGLKAGLRAEKKKKKPLTDKERKKFKRLLERQMASEAVY